MSVCVGQQSVEGKRVSFMFQRLEYINFADSLVDYPSFTLHEHTNITLPCLPQKRLESISAQTIRKHLSLFFSTHPNLLDSCVGVWQNDCIEIIANDQGNHATPSYVSFSNNEHLIGDAAKNQVAMNPNNMCVI
jgi:hypothetical protein